MAAQNEVTPEEFANFIKRASANINKALWEYMSNERSDRNIKRLLGRGGFEYDSEAIQRSIIEPSWYLIEKGGKRIRPIITLLVIEALGKDPMDYIEFSMIPEILHTATLVHDDIEDSSETRRGALSVYKKYGTDVALNLGDFLFFFPIKVLLDSKKLDDQVKYHFSSR
jgi:geranylgeranyl pyrophosphate synthase